MATVDDYILYIDHANHLTPLTVTYHATASRYLTSGRSDIIPPSTVVEVDSAYCPRSLTFCDVASAQANALLYGGGDGGGGGGGLYKDCPVCFSPVSISIDENTSTTITTAATTMTTTMDDCRLVCHYLCGHCMWSSRECGITSNADTLLEYLTADNDNDTIKESELEKQRQLAIIDISKELGNCLQQQHIIDKNKASDAIFNSIIKIWSEREQEEHRRKRMNITGTTSSISWRGNAAAVVRDSSEDGWSREILEQSLLDKKMNMETHYISRKAEYSSSSDDMQIINWDNVVGNPKNLPTQQQCAAQMTITNITPQSRSGLLPLPVYYRAKVSRRCRAELAAGRTGILVKPKLNPLEGDTSLRAGHGQWWKKDSSAIHVVPRVRLLRQGRTTDDRTILYAVLLSVKNPTLNMIRLRLATTTTTTTTAPSSASPAPPVIIEQREFENILVNPFTERFVQGHLCHMDALSSITPTDFFVLEPADDPFLDIDNKSSNEEGGDPLVVKNWDATATLGTIVGDGSSISSSKSKLQLVATKGDTAWVELLLCLDVASSPPPPTTTTTINDTNLNAYYFTVPLALQIEVGNGSWEASLIKRRDDIPDEEMDLVTFNLVALLR